MSDIYDDAQDRQWKQLCELAADTGFRPPCDDESPQQYAKALADAGLLFALGTYSTTPN